MNVGGVNSRILSHCRTGSLHVAQADLKLTNMLPRLQKCWEVRLEPTMLSNLRRCKQRANSTTTCQDVLNQPKHRSWGTLHPRQAKRGSASLSEC